MTVLPLPSASMSHTAHSLGIAGQRFGPGDPIKDAPHARSVGILRTTGLILKGAAYFIAAVSLFSMVFISDGPFWNAPPGTDSYLIVGIFVVVILGGAGFALTALADHRETSWVYLEHLHESGLEEHVSLLTQRGIREFELGERR